jgi:hypothetical protein
MKIKQTALALAMFAGIGLSGMPASAGTKSSWPAWVITQPNGQVDAGGSIASARASTDGNAWIESLFYAPVDETTGATSLVAQLTVRDANGVEASCYTTNPHHLTMLTTDWDTLEIRYNKLPGGGVPHCKLIQTRRGSKWAPKPTSPAPTNTPT